MNNEIYRQSPEFRAEVLRQAELARLAKAARSGRRVFRLFGRGSK